MHQQVISIKYLSLFIGFLFLFLFLPAAATAANITYPGYPLATDPFGVANSLFPGASLSGNTVIINGGNIGGFVEGGVVNGVANVTNNTVIVNYVDSVTWSVYGGKTSDGNAVGNTLSIYSGTLNGDVAGGFSLNGATMGNRLYVYGGAIRDDASGGSGFGIGEVTNNLAVIRGGTMHNVWGGNSRNAGSIRDNSVVMTGGNANGTVAGGGINNSLSTGAITDNSVEFSGTADSQFVYGGITFGSGSVSNNWVTIAGDATTFFVYGGYSQAGAVTGNSVTVTGGNIFGSVTGGEGGGLQTVSANEVLVSGGSIRTGVIGGNSGGDVTDNSVTVSGGHNDGYVYGAWSRFTGATSGNSVLFSDGYAAGDVYGGLSERGLSTSNAVTVEGGSIGGSVRGGVSLGNGDVSENTVTITGGIFAQAIYGGYANTGTASANRVSISKAGAALSLDHSDIYGAYASGSGDVIGNNVVIDGLSDTRTGSIGGGFGTSGSVNDNRVEITRSANIRVAGDIFGGFSQTGNGSTNNTVDIADSNGFQAGNIIGGYAPGGASSSGNRITFANSQNFSVGLVSGGESAAADPWRDNTFTAILSGGQAREIRNFQNYNFFLPNSLASGQALIHITGGTPTDMTHANVAITGIEGGGHYLQPGDYIDLIDSASGTPASVAATQVPKGFALLYDFDVSTARGSLRASLKKDELNPGGNVVPDGPIAGLIILSHFAELIDGLAAARIPEPQERRRGPSVYARVTGGTYRYSSKSDVDVDGGSLLIGADWRLGNLVLGGFFEAGRGNYDSTRHFAGLHDVKTRGDSTYFGGGILGFLSLPADFYAEASARAGRVETSFRSDTIHFLNRRVEYDISHAYYGAHAGIGYLYDIGGGSGLDIYAKYLWVRQAGKRFTVLGDTLELDPADSQRLRAGARYVHAFSQRLTGIVGAAFEYEFDGKVAGHVDRYTLEASGLRGGIAIGEIGLGYTTNRGFSMEVNAKGFVGMRKGVLGRVQLGFDF